VWANTTSRSEDEREEKEALSYLHSAQQWWYRYVLYPKVFCYAPHIENIRYFFRFVGLGAYYDIYHTLNKLTGMIEPHDKRSKIPLFG